MAIVIKTHQAKAKRRGRSGPRSKLPPLNVCCSQEERAALDTAARAAGLPVSVWVRQVALQEAAKIAAKDIGAPS